MGMVVMVRVMVRANTVHNGTTCLWWLLVHGRGRLLGVPTTVWTASIPVILKDNPQSTYYSWDVSLCRQQLSNIEIHGLLA